MQDAMDVDELVQTKVRPEYRGIVEEIRRIMRETAPQIKEVISYGIPASRSIAS